MESFRDPAGKVHLTGGSALRFVYPQAEAGVRDFLASSLRASLEEEGDLIGSSIACAGSHVCVRPGELWLEHRQIFPISYPWEWTPAQWRAAADLTLRIAERAISSGWCLKDATPLNIVFDGSLPLLVDALSLERRDPLSSIWRAYGQFVRTFLLPLVASKYLSWPLQDTIFQRDGYEPRTIYEALYPWQRWTPGLVDVVTLPTLFEGPHGNASAQKTRKSALNEEVAEHLIRARLKRLRRQIQDTAKGHVRSRWSAYAQSATHYSVTDLEDKRLFVQESLDLCRPKRVLDIGANTGTYSMLAAETGAQVVSLDSDETALEDLWRKAARDNLPITCVVANIARPTPAAGWCNREQLSLLERLAGDFDLVMLLAVVHHLILREQLPLAHIAGLCANLTRGWLLVEWVPPSDPMYQEWLRGREALYGHFTEADLVEAFSAKFEVIRRRALRNGRILLLFKSR